MSYMEVCEVPTCKACGRPEKFDFHVPDDLWEAVAPVELRNRVICLGCFDDFARAKRVEYATHLAPPLYFAGEAATFEFKVVSRQSTPPDSPK